MQKDKSFVVIDIETTGLNSDPQKGKVDYIIEVGAVRIEGNRIKKKFTSLCTCPYPLPKEIVYLTGILDKDLKDAPTIKEVLQKL